MSRRRGFSLPELLIALFIAGVIGMALTRLLINQSRFISNQDGMMRARGSSRAGLNVIVQELRMVGWGGLVKATRDSITVRVPYAFGVACSQPPFTGSQAVLLLPYDSANYASASLSGYAWRDALGAQHPVGPFAKLYPGASSADCTPPAVTPPIPATGSTLPSGALYVRIQPLLPLVLPATPAGSPVYLFQQVRYELAPSVQIPGRKALWRTQIEGGIREELVAPFDTTLSSFGFLVGNGLRYQAAAPAVLDSVRGIRLRLIGQSEDVPEGRTIPSQFDLITDIVFVNHGP